MNQKWLTNLGVSEVGAKYEEMFTDLLNVTTNDFRPTYTRKQVD